MMPYVTSFFMPRQAGDRPQVVPAGAVNFAFIGQFAETGRDCIFTTEYSVRTPMEAVYQLVGIDRGVPEVFSSTYDVRKMLAAMSRMRDGQKLKVPGPSFMSKRIERKLKKSRSGCCSRSTSSSTSRTTCGNGVRGGLPTASQAPETRISTPFSRIIPASSSGGSASVTK